jgi:hypothetical protein
VFTENPNLLIEADRERIKEIQEFGRSTFNPIDHAGSTGEHQGFTIESF